MRYGKLYGAVVALCLGAIVAGCSSPQRGSMVPLGAAHQARVYAPHGHSWMGPSASGQDLLYVTNGGENVWVYTYPKGELVGTLTGFISPLGECVDSAGDVFIVTLADKTGTSSIIYEYAHGGTQPIAVLEDPNWARGCAINPMTGDLAVAGDGVAIFDHASGDPTLYNSSVFRFYYCGYDAGGKLYLSGDDGQYLNRAYLVRLLSGSGQFEEITLGKTLYVSGDFWPSVQWDGKHMTISSASPGTRHGSPALVYRLQISGSSATIVGTTTLGPARRQFTSQLWIAGKKIVGAYNRHGSRVSRWPYPGGGAPKGIVRNRYGLVRGVAVSPARSGPIGRTRG
jgi:hypothetical protein